MGGCCWEEEEEGEEGGGMHGFVCVTGSVVGCVARVRWGGCGGLRVRGSVDGDGDYIMQRGGRLEIILKGMFFVSVW